MVSPQFLTHPARHADQVEAAIAFTIARLSGDSGHADRPSATNRVCTVCTAEVAAWPAAMCCHCQTMPWKLATPAAAPIGNADAEKCATCDGSRVVSYGGHDTGCDACAEGAA